MHWPFKCLKGGGAELSPRVHRGKMAGVLERSYVEICGFERESVLRFRQITLNLGNAFSFITVLDAVFSVRCVLRGCAR